METKLQLWLEEEDSPIGTLLLNGEEVSEISTELGETIVKRFNSHEALVEALRRISKVKPDRIDHVLDCVVLERAANIASEALKLAGEEA